MKFFKEIYNISPKAYISENAYIDSILCDIQFDFRLNDAIKDRTSKYISHIRQDKSFVAEHFLQKYNLSTEEGVAILSLAESLVRIPDSQTAQELIYDKISHKNWSKYIGFAKSRLTEISALGLYFFGKIVDIHTIENGFIKLSKKIADPVTLTVVKSAIEFLSKEFIIGYNPEDAFRKARKNTKFLYSFDLLGESARNKEQAEKYYEQYIVALDKINLYFPSLSEPLSDRPNLSVKLTALYPRLEALKLSEVRTILLPKLCELISIAETNGVTITFDAEECFRQDIYLQVITDLILDKRFRNFAGIGVVVQAYQKRAPFIIDYIKKLASKTGKQIFVRLVKGAYWDSEIKYAQENGFSDFPVFTKKEFTDANYIHCAKKLLEHNNLIYPQFATHNAQTAATIIELAYGKTYELQKLFGMGNSLHNELVKSEKCRIYAPIGKMEDLLAYLMRRLLENGANTSFVNKVNDSVYNISELTKPVYDQVKALILEKDSVFIKAPENIYPNRKNSKGLDLGYVMNIEKISKELDKFKNKLYKVGSIIDGREIIAPKNTKDVFKPGNLAEKIGEISYSNIDEINDSLGYAEKFFIEWKNTPVDKRAKILRDIALNLEANKYELYSLLIKEAGKTIIDAINEVREAIDFCNYYALSAERVITEISLPGPTGEKNKLSWHPRGVFLCISPWNFPLAIFLGQIVAALVTGNTVIAKPADQTSIIANFVAKLMYKSGLPKNALQIVLSSGRIIGETLVTSNRVKGVVFTGSTQTAKNINLNIAQRSGAIVPFIAETGGQNAMIVDSTALLEQVTDNAIQSAFYSAGQRCSALRVLYIQDEIYDNLLSMIKGAMNELVIGDTENLTVDIGAVIDSSSKENLEKHIENMREKGFNLAAKHNGLKSQDKGNFVYPAIIEISSINDLENENFGPILHVIKYKSKDLDRVINEINNYGYGLTFGLQTRLENKIDDIQSKMNTGNMYVNRTTIGAQVESHPFGGEGMSGTGFKAGGPHYLLKFMTERAVCINLTAIGGNIDLLSKVK
jgi:RHH-type transcriptional regulator, proline utilization regulon repressor / proline dehydrogenase / delta 1-pyrroline-5-carboxylate dehydrogenase